MQFLSKSWMFAKILDFYETSVPSCKLHESCSRYRETPVQANQFVSKKSKCNSVPMEKPSTLQYLRRATSLCLIVSNVAPFYDSTSWGVCATKARPSKVRQSLCEHLGTPRPWRQSLRGRPGKNKTKQGEAEPL